MDQTGGHREAGYGSETMVQAMEQCIEDCLDCHSICTTTLQHCLVLGGEHVRPEHVRSLMDCAELCQTSADFMLRGSELHTETCDVCAEACTRCADSCEHLGDDPQMQACADLCRRCAESCRHMVGMMAGQQPGHTHTDNQPPI